MEKQLKNDKPKELCKGPPIGRSFTNSPEELKELAVDQKSQVPKTKNTKIPKKKHELRTKKAVAHGWSGTKPIQKKKKQVEKEAARGTGLNKPKRETTTRFKMHTRGSSPATKKSPKRWSRR
ncbi:unnamed protein product [Dovyalis caffra]|uniref:Uncharacterized protein n=1 Tax=Dovyalis caffra TaxID=77055 RepID=A0AAV1S9R8_9ROSI|nr:unnamed protein product [Dovyalis caffra]